MQEKKHSVDERNYSSLADEFDMATAATETDAADELMTHNDDDGNVDDELICGDRDVVGEVIYAGSDSNTDDGVSSVRRRVPIDVHNNV